MATYSDSVVSTQTGTGTYTVPAGKFARVSIRVDFAGGNENTISIAGVSNVFDLGASTSVLIAEVILASGEVLNPGSATISWTALEYSNP